MSELVSIITPAYNASKHIPETIQSVINQTYKNWELIVVDDCSNDNTVAIVEKFERIDSRIKLIKNERNVQVAQARNIGIKHAQGRYLAFLDSDDLWDETKLEKQVVFINKMNCVLTYTYYYTFAEDLSNVKKMMRAPDSMNYNQVLKNTAIGCLTVLIDREKYDAVSMPLINHAEDTLTWSRVLKETKTKGHCLKEPLAFYRVANESLSGNKKNAIKQQWNIYRKHLKFSFIKSVYYFVCYAFNAVLRRIG